MLIVKRPRYFFIAALLVISLIAAVMFITVLKKNAHAASRPIVFPILGGGSFSNDYDAPRSNGKHQATDIFAPKHTPLVAAVDGTITFVAYPQPSYGYMVQITDSEGYQYNYIHINNDNNGTDDGNGGPMNAYAPDMKQGNRVYMGQHIGWVGDSGNAETTPPHLHFEIVAPNGEILNPYESLPQAPRLNHPNLYPALTGENLPYGNAINSTVQVAAGNLDGDPASEYVTAAGAGVGPHVRVFNQDNSFGSYGFFAYNDNYRGGVTVATGDVDNDGVDEVITGTGVGSTTHVRIFEANGQYISGFFAYGGYHTGVNVAAGDIDNDGIDEIITGTGAGSTTHVKVFEPNGQFVKDFIAYPGYPVGVDVGVGDVNNDGQAEIITSAGPGGGPHVKVINGQTLQEISSFFAYQNNFFGGVRIDVGNVRTATAQDEILTAPYSGGGPDFRVFNATGTMLTRLGLYENWWTGGYDIAAAEGYSKVGTGGNRRASVRSGPQ